MTDRELIEQAKIPMCKYWDCGWCYAPVGTETNANGGACNNPVACQQYYKSTRAAAEIGRGMV